MKIEDIIDSIDGKDTLSAQQVEEMEDDTEMRETLEDIALATDVLRGEQAPTVDEVEKRLRHFHRRHQDCKGKNRGSHLIIYIGKIGLSVAAVLSICIFLLWKEQGADEALVLKVDKAQMLVKQTKEEGKEIAAAMSKDTLSHEPMVDMATISETFAATDTIRLNVPRGNSCKVVLPDGSLAYLHPGSSLTYPKQFEDYQRNVKLEGEAYFKIKKDRQRPFTVYTDHSQTLVTGTEFDITAIGGQPETITLINGSVQFSAMGSERKVTLSPGQQASLSDNGTLSLCTADTMQYVAWRDGYLYFDNASLQSILSQISQAYNVAYVCHDPNLLNYRMHIFIRRDKDLADVVASLNKMKKVKATIRQDKLHIE